MNFKTFKAYMSAYDNPLSIMVRTALNKFPFKAKLKNGLGVEIKSKRHAWFFSTLYNLDVIYVDDRFIEFRYKDRVLKFYFDINYYTAFGEIFRDGIYNVDMASKIVVDIGAGVGDSPIYFALNGAKKVIGFEPFPKIFLIAKKNIEENGLRDKIILVNAGCGYDGKVKINPELDTNPMTSLKDQRDGIEVPVYSLNTIVENFDVEEGSILKVDCEGCEYDLLRTADINAIRRFSKIIIEYHNGIQHLADLLRASGFDVTIRGNKKKIGLIYAR